MLFLTDEVLAPWIVCQREKSGVNATATGSEAFASPPLVTLEILEEFCIKYFKRLEDQVGGIRLAGVWGESEIKDPEKIKIPEGFYIFRGTEISTDHGHLLAYGLKDDSWNISPRSNYLNIFDVITSVHDHGGICVPAHPYRGWDSVGEDIFKIDGFDAIETHNGRNVEEENQKAIKAAQFNKLPSIGGSDCHHLEEVGRAFTLFKNPVHTLDELIKEIKNRNCKGTTI